MITIQLQYAWDAITAFAINPAPVTLRNIMILRGNFGQWDWKTLYQLFADEKGQSSGFQRMEAILI